MGVTVSDPGLVARTSGAILHHESGSTSTKLNNPTSYAGAVGPGQIMPATAKPYMLPGENLNDPATNVAIHNRIMADYARRWPNDPARWAVAYFSGPGNVSQPGSPTPYIKNTSDGHNTVAQYVANTAGKAGSATPNVGAATTTTPGTTLNTPPPATSIANALAGANGQGLSPIQQAQKDIGGEGGQPLSPAPAPQLGMPSMHNQQVEAQAPQLMAALRTANAQPLSWGSQPFGSTAGPRGGAPPQTMAYFGGQWIPMPGTTLNSNAGLYG